VSMFYLNAKGVHCLIHWKYWFLNWFLRNFPIIFMQRACVSHINVVMKTIVYMCIFVNTRAWLMLCVYDSELPKLRTPWKPTSLKKNKFEKKLFFHFSAFWTKKWEIDHQCWFWCFIIKAEVWFQMFQSVSHKNGNPRLSIYMMLK